MHTQARSAVIRKTDPMPELVEVLLSALAGCGLVLLLAFFLSLESWVTSLASVG
ncbi:MAG: hypothetical protein ACRESW_08860 [Nevskiales bacterium]